MKKDLRLLAHYAKRHWLMYLIGIAALFIVDLINTVIPRLVGQITDGLDEGSMEMAEIQRLILMILGAGLVIAIGRFCWRRFLLGASRQIQRDMRGDLFAHLETLSSRYYHANKTGDLMAHFTNDIETVQRLMGMTIITAFDATVMLIMVLYSMIRFVDVRLTLAAVVPLIIIIFGDIAFGKVMHRRYLAKQEAFSGLTDMVQESVSGIRVIKAFVQERRELAAFAKSNRNNYEKNMGVVRLIALVFPLLDFIIGVSMLVTLLFGGWLVIQNGINGFDGITIGEFVAFNSYIGMLVWPMIAAGECVSSLSQGMASTKRVRSILDEQPDIVDGPDCDSTITSLSGSIDVEHLTFAYPDGEGTAALSDVSVHVRAGETLAIVGRTGCGKTTLVSLLERLYETEKADMIRMDGHPLRTIPLHVLRRDIAIVPQDNFLFSDTIANNIAFGVESTTREAIEEAAKTACVHDNILEFPDGYDTLVGERGVTISGGQKQRTSIARALLKNAPILILDDSLSAVDTDTEEQILMNLKRIRKGQTTLMIAHRISTIQHADHILVLEEGRVAEYGTHDELMKMNGIYHSIWQKQQLEKQLREEGGEAQ